MAYTYEEYLEKTKNMTEEQQSALREFAFIAGQIHFNVTFLYTKEQIIPNLGKKESERLYAQEEAYNKELRQVIPESMID